MTITEEFTKALWAVGKDLYAEKKRRDRDARTARRPETTQKGKEITLKDACFEVVPIAIERASGNGSYMFDARSLYYAVRPLVQQLTAAELKMSYFGQSVINAYEREHGEIEPMYREPRGVLREPHSDPGGREIPLGTREIREYIFPDHVFNKIFCVEKSGFDDMFRVADLANHYDMAIVSGKGQPTKAARELLTKAEAAPGEYELYVLHDADHSGYIIARTHREATELMPGYSAHVIDLGLSVEGAINLGLPQEKYTRKNALPKWMPERLSPVEREWFEGRLLTPFGKPQWACTRVELNALLEDLVPYIERQLDAHGAVGKLVPPPDVIARKATDRHRAEIRVFVEDAIAKALDIDGMVNHVIRSTIEMSRVNADGISAEFDEDDSISWRTAVEDIIGRRLDEKAKRRLRNRVRKLLKRRMGNV